MEHRIDKTNYYLDIAKAVARKKYMFKKKIWSGYC